MPARRPKHICADGAGDPSDRETTSIRRLSFDSFFASPAQTRVFVRTALQSRSTGMHLQPGPVLRPDRTGLETRPHSTFCLWPQEWPQKLCNIGRDAGAPGMASPSLMSPEQYSALLEKDILQFGNVLLELSRRYVPARAYCGRHSGCLPGNHGFLQESGIGVSIG